MKKTSNLFRVFTARLRMGHIPYRIQKNPDGGCSVVLVRIDKYSERAEAIWVGTVGGGC